jgi:hypothetical protein
MMAKQVQIIARKIMEIMEENQMTLFQSEANQMYLYDTNAKECQCLNDMRDSFDVEILKGEPNVYNWGP